MANFITSELFKGHVTFRVMRERIIAYCNECKRPHLNMTIKAYTYYKSSFGRHTRIRGASAYGIAELLRSKLPDLTILASNDAPRHGKLGDFVVFNASEMVALIDRYMKGE